MEGEEVIKKGGRGQGWPGEWLRDFGAARPACVRLWMIRRLCYKDLGKTAVFGVNFFQHTRLKKEGTISREFIKIPDECPRFHVEDSDYTLAFVNSWSFRKAYHHKPGQLFLGNASGPTAFVTVNHFSGFSETTAAPLR